MNEEPLSLIAGRLARDRDTCEWQRATASKQLEVAKARNDELREELKTCEADKLVAQKAVSDAHARVRTTKDAIALVEKQSAVAAAVLMHKETQLSQYSDCCILLHQQSRELEEKQKRIFENADRQASTLKCEVELLRKDAGQQDVLRSQLEQSRQEMLALSGSLDNARANASAALSERDCLRRDLSEIRRRLADTENQASTLRTEASVAKASATAALSQLGEVCRELKEADRLKSACITQASDLQTQVDLLKAHAPISINHAEIVPKEVDALQKKYTSMMRRAEGLAITSKVSTSSALVSDGVKQKRVEAYSQNVFQIAISPSAAIRSSGGEDLTSDRLKVACVDQDYVLRDVNSLPEAPSNKKIGSHVVATQSKLLRHEPAKAYGSRNACGEQRYQHQQIQEHAQRQVQQMQNHKSSGPSMTPLQLSRSRSRLWVSRNNGVAVVKRKKRGCIFRADLEKVGYTPGCRGCEEAYNKADQPRSHTEACRARVYAEMVRLNLPGARRLRDAEVEMSGREPKRRRNSTSNGSRANHPGSGAEVQEQAPVTQSTRSMMSSIVRACAIK